MNSNLAQPHQTDDFGIGNFLTETTSNGKEGGNAETTSNLGQGKEVGDKSVPDPAGSQERSLDTSTSPTEKITPTQEERRQ